MVTLFDWDKNDERTLHKYAIKQINHCESEPWEIETTNIVATLYSKARATTLTEYKLTAKFSEKNLPCSQVSNGNKNRLEHKFEKILQLNPDDCKTDLRRFKLTTN